MSTQVIYSFQADLCHAMSHPTRIQILHVLFSGPKNVTELVHQCELSQTTISRNLAVLKRAGIVVSQRHGQEIIYAIANPKIIEVCNMMRQVISEQLAEQSALLSDVDQIKYT